ncbi:MAG: glucuronate isomerase [Anaeroplasmataceae bacterium]
MKKFLDKDFLLESETAKKLYFDYAKDMPIYDYHNHLSAKEIFENKNFDNMSQVWLGADHYKWRVLRTNGVKEELITGKNADPYEKFLAFAETLPFTIGNPMHHWSHLELQRYFSVDEPLTPENAKAVYDKCNELLKTKDFTPRSLLERMNVKALCTTDDPADDLQYHKAIKDEKYKISVKPTYRPETILNIENPTYLPYIERVSKLGYQLKNVKDIQKFLSERMDFFHEVGCRLSDHSLTYVDYINTTEDKVNSIIAKVLSGKTISNEEAIEYRSYLYTFLGKEYNKRGWVMQLHLGALRNNSTKMYESIGADAGFDSAADKPIAEGLSKLLNSIDITNELPKTIIYGLNNSYNTVIGTMIGNFQGGGIVGKIQFGSGWWFLDTKKGMIEQMNDLASLGLLSRFVGMLTDSRSFLSFTRHEYFRRIMCNEIGKLVENGEYPADYKYLEQIIKGICYNNINNFIKE